MNLVRGKHLIDVGIQYDTRSVYGNHNSFASHGSFTFNGQYTGNGFADYLLGLTSSAARNYPIAPFGEQHAPYSGIFVEDTYKITRNFTLNLGLRYDHWYNKTLVHGNGATFDPANRQGDRRGGLERAGGSECAAGGSISCRGHGRIVGSGQPGRDSRRAVSGQRVLLSPSRHWPGA